MSNDINDIFNINNIKMLACYKDWCYYMYILTRMVYRLIKSERFK